MIHKAAISKPYVHTSNHTAQQIMTRLTLILDAATKLYSRLA